MEEDTEIVSETESSPESQEKTPDSFIEDIATDYVNYTQFDSAKEKEKFNENIEGMLTKMEEFCGLVDMIRADTSICLTETLPRIQTKCSQMQEIFEKIDKLEAFVAMVKTNVGVLEECVNKAEDEMGSLSGLKKMLSSFVGPKKPVSKAVFNPPEIFSTKDYFPGPQEKVQTEDMPTEK